MLLEVTGLNPELTPERFEQLPVDLEKTQKFVDLLAHEGEPPWFWVEGNKTSRCPACCGSKEIGHFVKCPNKKKKCLEQGYKCIVPLD